MIYIIMCVLINRQMQIRNINLFELYSCTNPLKFYQQNAKENRLTREHVGFCGRVCFAVSLGAARCPGGGGGGGGAGTVRAFQKSCEFPPDC